MMFLSECKKHLGRYSLLILTVLFLANLTVPLLLYADAFSEKSEVIRESRDTLLTMAKKDPEAYAVCLADHTAKKRLFEHQTYIASIQGDFAYPAPPTDYIAYPDYNDIHLFQTVESILHASDEYQEAIASLLREAALRLMACTEENSYRYRYYDAMIRAYEPFYTGTLPNMPVDGWENYFSLSTIPIFLFLASLVLFAGVFPVENKVGMRPILTVSKYGRKRTTAVKLCAITVESVCITLLFSLTPLLLFAFSTGLSDPTMPVQRLSSMLYCRFSWSIGGYLCRLTLYRILFFAVCSLCIAVLGQYGRNELASIFGSAAAFGIGLFLERLSEQSPLAQLRGASCILLGEGTYVFDRFRPLHIGSYCLDYTPVALAGIAALGILAVSFALLERYPRRIRKSRRHKNGFSPMYSLSLLRAELYKQFFCQRGILVLLAAILLHGLWAEQSFRQYQTIPDAMYENYLTTFAGPLTQDTLDAIEAESNRVETVLFEYPAKQGLYMAGKISNEELDAYQAEYTTATYQEEAVQQLKETVASLRTVEERFSPVSMLPYEGITCWLSRPYDVFSIFVILFFAQSFFPMEYDTGLAPIAFCTHSGRGRLTRRKTVVALCTALVLLLITDGIDWYFIKSRFLLRPEDLSAAAQSIPALLKSKLPLTIRQYLLCHSLFRYAGVCLCWFFSLFAGALVKSAPKAIALLAPALFLPYLIACAGTDVFFFLNFANITAPVVLDTCFLPFFVLSLLTAIILFCNRRLLRR